MHAAYSIHPLYLYWDNAVRLGSVLQTRTSDTASVLVRVQVSTEYKYEYTG